MSTQPDFDPEIERLRQVDAGRMLRPVWGIIVISELFVVGLAVPVYSARVLLVTLAALCCIVAAQFAADARVAVASRPEVWMLLGGVLSFSLLAVVVALSGGLGSPALPLIALTVTISAARLRGVPLAIEITVMIVGVAIACLVAGSPPPGASPARIAAWIPVIVGIAAVVTALAHSERDARGNAVLDPLTGLLNRAALDNRLRELQGQARQTGLPVSLIMCDLDGFKRVNDTLGHEVGDRVLEQATYAMRMSLRSFELVYRLGGDEFVVLLPGCDLPAASEVAERLRTAVLKAEPGGQAVTLSAGVACAHGAALDPDGLARAADGALYAAKFAGRNTVRTANEGAVSAPAPVPAVLATAVD